MSRSPVRTICAAHYLSRSCCSRFLGLARHGLCSACRCDGAQTILPARSPPKARSPAGVKDSSTSRQSPPRQQHPCPTYQPEPSHRAAPGRLNGSGRLQRQRQSWHDALFRPCRLNVEGVAQTEKGGGCHTLRRQIKERRPVGSKAPLTEEQTRRVGGARESSDVGASDRAAGVAVLGELREGDAEGSGPGAESTATASWNGGLGVCSLSWCLSSPLSRP